MLLSYRFSDFKSFGEETIFSMRPGRMPSHLNENAVQLAKGVRALKSAVIAGENAGGKSNFISSFDYFQYCINSQKRVRIAPNTINWNWKDDKSARQAFTLEVFIEPNLVYRYTVALKRMTIECEKLEYRKYYQKDYELIFETLLEQYQEQEVGVDDQIKVFCSYSIRLRESFAESVRDAVSATLQENAYKNGLLLPFVANLDSYAQPFLDWTVNRLVVARSPYSGTNYISEEIEDEKIVRILRSSEYFEIFRMIDETITDIRIDEKKPFADSVIYRENEEGERFECKIMFESKGVRQFFGWAIQIWQVIYENKIVLADEVDSVINPILASKIINYINGTDHHGQFIFTTHNILHLNTACFAKEQMWFIHKDNVTTKSEMYSLADFEEFSYSSNQNVYELYMKGLLGGTGNG